jgi:ferredoxin
LDVVYVFEIEQTCEGLGFCAEVAEMFEGVGDDQKLEAILEHVTNVALVAPPRARAQNLDVISGADLLSKI